MLQPMIPGMESWFPRGSEERPLVLKKSTRRQLELAEIRARVIMLEAEVIRLQSPREE